MNGTTWTNSATWGTASTATTLIYPVTITGSGVSIAPLTPPNPPTAFDWLDAEVERTCAKARLAA